MELFPDIPAISELITGVNSSAVGVWSEFYLELLKCYDEDPINDARIRRIYEFAESCIDRPETENIENAVSNAVAVGFLESLPLDARVAEDLHRWFTLERFDGYAALFRHHLTETELKELSARFGKKRKLFVDSRKWHDLTIIVVEGYNSGRMRAPWKRSLFQNLRPSASLFLNAFASRRPRSA